jgi:hypothetical protein
MVRLVKDFIEINDHASLDTLIETLTALRASLPAGADAELRMRGDDVFGRHLSVSFFREQTAEEVAAEARYSDAYRASREQELARLQNELGFGHPHLRVAA